MPDSAVTIVLAVAAAFTLLLLIPSLRQARAAGDLDISSALTLGMAWLTSLPIALVAITGGLTRRPDAFGELVPIFPSWYANAVDFAVFFVAALAVIVAMRRLGAARIPVHAAGLLAILLWALAHVSGLQDGRVPALRGSVLLVCLLAATVLPRGRGAPLGAGLFGVTLAATSGFLAVFRGDAAFVVPCVNACEGLGFTGVFPNPDLLGVTLAVSIPFAYIGFRTRARYWFVLYLAGMATATGSRTAILVSLVSILVLLVVRPRVDTERTTAVRTAIAGLVLAGAVASSIYVVRHDWDPSALTDRPALWNVASEHVDESPWFGYGPQKWASLFESGEIPRAAQRSTHNQWMDVLVAAGAVGASVFAAMLAAMLWTAGRARAGVMVMLTTITLIGTTEGTWSVGTLDFLSFSLVAAILTGEPEPEQRASPQRMTAPFAGAPRYPARANPVAETTGSA
ncbi:MAG TPA: O-antigen ligase family protein [Vicinamibacterales bacterium]|nr:O-antigen ligase family protein [Vicinamibacterales bacterium]